MRALDVRTKFENLRVEQWLVFWPSELHILELRPPPEIPERMAATVNTQTTANII